MLVPKCLFRSALRKRRVLCLAVVDLRKADRSGGNCPGLVRADHLGSTVSVIDDQNRQQRGTVAIVVRRGIESQGTAVPAPAQRDAQLVRPFLHFERISLILKPLMIVRPAGSKKDFSLSVTQRLAVEFSLIEAQCRCVQSGAPDFFIRMEGSDKDRACCLLFRERMRDPGRVILKSTSVQETCLKPGGSCSALSAVIPDGDFPSVLRPGGENRSQIFNQRALSALNPAGVPHFLTV